jgi:dolichol-phosphate mannosyltransferase
MNEVKLSIVVPVFNEAGNTLPLIEEISEVLSQFGPYEIIYVNDGSSDDTPLELSRASQRFPELRMVHHSVRCGKSAAIMSGVMKANAPLIGTLDGDGQDDPKYIPLFLEAFGAQEASPKLGLVAGKREKRIEGMMRKISSYVANTVRRAFLRDGCSDSGCGLKMFRRDPFIWLPHFEGVHRFLPSFYRAFGYEVIEIEVKQRPRLFGKSKYGMHNRLWVGLLDLMMVLWLRHRCQIPFK